VTGKPQTAPPNKMMITLLPKGLSKTQGFKKAAISAFSLSVMAFGVTTTAL